MRHPLKPGGEWRQSACELRDVEYMSRHAWRWMIAKGKDRMWKRDIQEIV